MKPIVKTVGFRRNYSPIFIQKRMVLVDESISDIIETLNDLGVKTLASCSGHGRYPSSIFIQTQKGVCELVSGKFVTRTRNFYRKDKYGFYEPITEVSL